MTMFFLRYKFAFQWMTPLRKQRLGAVGFAFDLCWFLLSCTRRLHGVWLQDMEIQASENKQMNYLWIISGDVQGKVSWTKLGVNSSLWMTLRHSRRGRASRCGRSDGRDWDGVRGCWVSQSHMKKVMCLMHDVLLMRRALFSHSCPFRSSTRMFFFTLKRRASDGFHLDLTISICNRGVWPRFTSCHASLALGWSTYLYPACLSGNLANLTCVFKTHSINLFCLHFHGQLLKSMT